MLEVLFQSLTERVWNLVEADELFDLLHLSMVARRAGVQSLDDGAHITEDAGIHQRCAYNNTQLISVQSERQRQCNVAAYVSDKCLFDYRVNYSPITRFGGEQGRR